MSGKLFLISASSGAGKTTLVKELMKKVEKNNYPLKGVVGYTSRPPRAGEVHGSDYYFISQQDFEHKIAVGEFLEWNYGYGNFYGTPISVLDDLKNGISVVAVIGIRAVEDVLVKVPGAIPIWITVSGLDVLSVRLRQRGGDEHIINERLEIARKEFEWLKETKIFKHIIVNDVLEAAVEELVEITCGTN